MSVFFCHFNKRAEIINIGVERSQQLSADPSGASIEDCWLWLIAVANLFAKTLLAKDKSVA